MAEIGSGNGSSYPGSLDSDASLEVDSPSAGKTKARAAVVNDLASAIVALQTELGVDPAGTLTNVKTFLQTEHETSGAHKDTHVVNMSGIQTITGSKTFIHLNASGNMSFGPVVTISGRYKAGGTALTSSDFTLHANWGSGPTVDSISAVDQRGTFTVTAGSSGTGANPTIVITFKGGTWTSAPIAIVHMHGGSGTLLDLTWTTSATALTITYPGTPVAGTNYIFSFIVIG